MVNQAQLFGITARRDKNPEGMALLRPEDPIITTAQHGSGTYQVNLDGEDVLVDDDH